MTYRQGNINDADGLKKLAVISWLPYKQVLLPKYWNQLNTILNDDENYMNLLEQSHCLVCESEQQEIIGMAFLVPKGNPTDIYDKEWSYIRFLSVHPAHSGAGIGRKLTEQCIEYAKENNETIVALHTSEIMGKAIKLYESLGFKILREIEPRLGKRYWLYSLKL